VGMRESRLGGEATRSVTDDLEGVRSRQARLGSTRSGGGRAHAHSDSDSVAPPRGRERERLR